MKNMRHVLSFLCLCLLAMEAGGKNYTLSSPNKNLKLDIAIDNTGMYYSVYHKDSLIMSRNHIGLNSLPGEAAGGERVVSDKVKRLEEKIRSPFYRFKSFRTLCNEIDLKLENGFGVQFRAYDEGVAYRFYSEVRKGLVIADELAEFNFAGDYTAYLPYTTNEEKPTAMAFQNTYDVKPLSEARKQLAFLPVTVDCGSVKVTLLESDLEAYPGMFVMPSGSHGLKGVFAHYPKKMEFYPYRKQSYVVETEDYIAKVRGTRTFPWRVIAVSEEDTRMPVNNLVYTLASPNRIGDYSWVKPGKVAWEWWNDWNLKGVPFKSGINMDTYRYYIDFAARWGLEYVVLDEGWYDSKSGDMLQAVPELDLPQLVAYAKCKGVDLVLWTVFNVLDSQLEEACRKYADMGIKGFKVDFLDRDDQTAVEMAYRIAEKAARYKLILDYHGIYKPTGMNRTYPNVINFESVFGMEEMKWSEVERNMPLYDVTFPYIRMMAGYVDYTPGAMRNATRRDFKPMYYTPMSMGTRCHQLAAYIVYDSPFTMLCDAPTNYIGEEPCVEFISSVPVEADSTFLPMGELGKYIVTARKKGENWYIGGMTNWDERNVTLDFSFLSDGEVYRCTVFQDGINASRQAEDYVRKETTVTAGTRMDIHLASGGGFAMKLERMDGMLPSRENRSEQGNSRPNNLCRKNILVK